MKINEKPDKLLFGYRYSGLIDEIGIFDYALSPFDINLHQQCRGCYEVN